MTETATSPRALPRAEPHVGVAGPRARGPATPRSQGWLFIAPALIAYGVFVLWPLVNTVRTRCTMGRRRARAMGRTRQLQDRVHRPPARGVLEHAFQLIIYFTGIPVILGLVVASVMRRVATPRVGSARQDGAVPTPGGPARRGRDRLELGALDDRRRQPGALGDRPRAASPGRGSATSAPPSRRSA